MWDRSSVDPAVANLSFSPKPEKDWTPAVSALLIRRVTLSPPPDVHMRERIRGQIVGYRQRRVDPLTIVKNLRYVVVHVCEASPLMMLLPFQFDGEFT